MKKYFEKTLPKIEKAVREYLPEKTDLQWINKKIGPVKYQFNTQIWEKVCSQPFYDLFNRGGKRLRPVLTCLTHQALGGNNSEIYKFSIIPEIIHNGSLIIDDIEDDSILRRGKEVIHKIYGTGLAVNNGNFFYFFPQLIIKEADLPDSKKLQLYNLIIEEMTKLHLGQGMDILWGNQSIYKVSINDYSQSCAYKTGSMISVALKIGAILANADNKIIQKLGDLAVLIGLAFQIQDDILNLKSSKEWGKEFGEDITEGKLTYLVADTIAQAQDIDKNKLIKILSAKTKKRPEIEAAIAIMDKYDAFSRAHEFSEKSIMDAKKIVNEVFNDSDNKRVFLEILDLIVNRKK